VIVRIRLAVNYEVEHATEEQRQRVEISLAQFQEGLEAVIASKVESEFPAAHVEFEDEEGE
jgi:hypothetical protein